MAALISDQPAAQAVTQQLWGTGVRGQLVEGKLGFLIEDYQLAADSIGAILGHSS